MNKALPPNKSTDYKRSNVHVFVLKYGWEIVAQKSCKCVVLWNLQKGQHIVQMETHCIHCTHSTNPLLRSVCSSAGHFPTKSKTYLIFIRFEIFYRHHTGDTIRWLGELDIANKILASTWLWSLRVSSQYGTKNVDEISP